MEELTVGVIIPVKNCAPFIAQSISSILQQSYQDIRVVVVDDASSDGSAEVAESLADPRVTVLRKDRSSGIEHSLNLGLEVLDNEYVARMDGDDISERDRLDIQKKFLDSNPDTCVIGSFVWVIDQSRNIVDQYRYPCDDKLIKWSMYFCNPLSHPSVMFRRVCVHRAGGYDPCMLHVEDYDLWLRLRSTCRFANIPVPLLRWRRHAGGVSSAHAALMRSNAARAAQRAISSDLGRPVPLGVVEAMQSGRFLSSGQRAEAARVLLDLYEVACRPSEGRRSSTVELRRHAAQLIYRWGRLRVQGLYAPGLVCRSFMLDPGLAVRAAGAIARRGRNAVVARARAAWGS